ncbi:MAG: hypothetical protein JWN86_415 [Planctomycetota bacterium]|nr:hypothetical protein [Planctomycetota bacterium]
MDGHPSQARPTRLSRRFPPVRLLRGVGIALDARKMILAAVGLALLGAGWELLNWLFNRNGTLVVGVDPEGVSDRMLGLPLSPESLAWAVAEPFRVLTAPFVGAFSTAPGVRSFVHAILAAVWAVAVWGILGGAIARIAAVQQATGDRIGIVRAVRFALSRALGLVGAPLAPMIGIGFFAALCAPIGLLYRIPGPIGATVAGALAVLPLLAGLMMSLLLVGVAAGWPLMIATVAVEAEDAFDALSRAYSYVYSRPSRYAAYVLISWAAGVIGLLVVMFFAWLVVHLAQWGLSFGGPSNRIGGLFFGGPKIDGSTPARVHAAWLTVVRLLTHGWIYSYFFTSATLIFVLLRHEVDGAAFHDLGGTGAEDLPFAPELPQEGAIASKTSEIPA